MKNLIGIPDEFMKPIVFCLEIFKFGNILIYAKANSFWEKFLRPFLVLTCVPAFYVSLSMHMCKLVRGEFQLDELAFVVGPYTFCTQTLVKATIATLYKKEIRSVIEHMGRLWRTEDLTEVQMVKKNVLLKRLNLVMTAFYWMQIIGTWQYSLAPIIETVIRKYILQQECGLLLPYFCSFPFDPSGNWVTYIGVYIFETYGMIHLIHYYIGTEFLMIILCSHLATEFVLLQEDLVNNDPCDPGGLKLIVEKHQQLLSLAEQLDDIFDKLIFVNLTSATITICFFGFGAKVTKGALNIAKNVVPVVAMSVPILILCYFCEILSESSAGMADAAFNNLWCQGDIRYKKFMWLILTRSQKACYMTSMKYKPIDLKTFTAVLGTTWSYFSLISSFDEGEN